VAVVGVAGVPVVHMHVHPFAFAFASFMLLGGGALCYSAPLFKTLNTNQTSSSTIYFSGFAVC
jgi:hypothetical protein